MRNCAKEIFLRPCSKDQLVLMQLKPSLLTVYCSATTMQKSNENRIDLPVLGLAGCHAQGNEHGKMELEKQVRRSSVPDRYHRMS